jgi:hypothetical protein
MQFIPEQLTSIADGGGKGPASAQSAVLRPVRPNSVEIESLGHIENTVVEDNTPAYVA